MEPYMGCLLPINKNSLIHVIMGKKTKCGIDITKSNHRIFLTGTINCKECYSIAKRKIDNYQLKLINY